jgi:hypothetical protein
MDDTQFQLKMPDSNPIKLPGDWAFVPPSDDVRRLTLADDSRGPDASGSPLAENGQDALTPALKDGCFVVMRNDPAGPPLDFVTARDRAAGSDPPALHCCEDYFTRSKAAKYGFVLAAFSGLDLATMRLLRLPVTSASGLARLTAQESQLLLAATGKRAAGEPQQGANTPAERTQFKLILVGAEVFELKNQMPRGLLNAITHFRRIERTLGVKLDEQIGIWLPPAAEFRAVTDAVALADRGLVRSKIVASIKRSTMSVAGYLKSTAGPPVNDLFAARQELLNAITALPTATFGSREVKTRFGDFSRAFDVALIERIRRDAMAAGDSLDRGLLTIAAELMQMHFESSDLVQRAVGAIETGNAAHVMLTLENRLDLNLKIARGLETIHKHLHKR